MITLIILFVSWYLIGIGINIAYTVLFHKDALKIWQGIVSLLLLSFQGPLTLISIFKILKLTFDNLVTEYEEMNSFINDFVKKV